MVCSSGERKPCLLSRNFSNVCCSGVSEEKRLERSSICFLRYLSSAKGAEYDSQGQARSASPLVTDNKKFRPALKARNSYFGPSGLCRTF
jgi:hypothetical protein